MLKKKPIIISIIVCVILMLIPIKTKFKDGGTVKYSAVLYSVTFYHSINDSCESGYYEDTVFEIFPFNFID